MLTLPLASMVTVQFSKRWLATPSMLMPFSDTLGPGAGAGGAASAARASASARILLLS
jgi:hypothetical protein